LRHGAEHGKRSRAKKRARLSLSGWGGTLGGGVEVRLTSNWSTKAEYLNVRFQSANYFSNPPPGFNERSDVPLDNNLFRFGINYAFR
jgi:opacity protein-like surface antigen